MSLFTYEDQGDRRYLVYEKKEEDSIDTLTLEMMSNNRIDGVISSNSIWIDDKFYMKYDITGMQSLREYLKGVAGRQKVLGVLESITDASMAADDYMLSLSSYVLDLDYMYIDSAAGKVFMIVLPIMRDGAAIETFLKELLVDVRYDQTEDCGYVAALISILGNQGAFSMPTFKEQIEQFRKDKKHSGIKQQEQQQSQVQPQAPQQPWSQASQQSQVQPQAPRQPWPQDLQQARVQPQASWQSQQARLQLQVPQQSQQAWHSMQPQQPGRMGIELSEEERKKIVHDLKRETDLDILFSDGDEKNDKKEKKGFFFRKEKADKSEKEKKTEKKSFWGKLAEGKKGKSKEDSEVESMMEGLAIPGLDNHNRQKTDHIGKDSPFLQGASQEHDIVIPAQNVGIDRKTVDIQDFGETVYIGDEEDTFIFEAGQAAVKPKFVLYRCSTQEEFPIYEEMTRIGRSSSIAEICITGNRGVGRVHALLHLRNGEVFIEDNNSKNKTYVDGMQLEPGQSPVKLNNGSKIRLGDEELEFREQNV